MTDQQQTERSDSENERKHRRWVLLLILLVIALAIGGIFLFKKGQDEALPDTLDVSETFDFEQLKSLNKPMLLDFGSEDCPPCQAMRPALAAIHEAYSDTAVITYVDVYVNPAAVGNFPVSVIPTQFFFYADGTPYIPPAEYQDLFTLYTYTETGEHGLTAHVGGLTWEEMERILLDLGAGA